MGWPRSTSSGRKRYLAAAGLSRRQRIAAGAPTGLDPNFRPSLSHQFDFTIQRQISNKISIEFGYIGRKITHEFQPVNINAVPYMMTLGGQSFAKAYGQMVMQYCGGNAGLAGGGCTGDLVP